MLGRAAGHQALVPSVVVRIALAAVNKVIVLVDVSRGIRRGRIPAVREWLEDRIGEVEVVVQ